VDSDVSEYQATPNVKTIRVAGRRLMGPSVLRYQAKMFSEWGYKPLAFWQPCPEIGPATPKSTEFQPELFL
jgi:hypothetical protein